LLLVERGLLDVHAPVSRYWPEFAANGKQDILVRHVISHTSGVSGFDEPMILEDLYDWDKTTSILARQAPFWTPGTQSGYHSFTMGFLIGELVRRVTGKTYKDFVAEKIAGPLAADFQIGVKDGDRPRVSDVIAFPPPSEMPIMDSSSVAFKSMMNPPFEPSLANSADWRHADLGAANGHSNALGVARIVSAIALGGEVDGKRLLSPSTIDLIFQEQSLGKDLVTGQNLRFGIGFGLSGKGTAVSFLPEGRICFWGGLGGSMIIADLDRRLTISYMMNKLSPVGLASDRAKEYIAAIYKALGVSE
jgi:CubicO group peptidase (beta-lactamase class C family)